MSTGKHKSFKIFGKRGTGIDTKEELPRRLTDRQLQGPVGLCRLCQGELYRGDAFWQIEGSPVCEECFGAFARRYFAPCYTTGEELTREEEIGTHHDADTTVF